MPSPLGIPRLQRVAVTIFEIREMLDATRPDGADFDLVYDFIRGKALPPIDQPTSEVVYNLLVNKQADRHVVAALDRIVRHPDFDGEVGLLFINRCVYTAINPLHLDPQRHDDLKRLVQRLATANENGMNRTTRRLRQTLRRYVADEKYQCVLRQAKLYGAFDASEETVLGDLFPEYSFLYLRAGFTKDIEEAEESVRPAGSNRQRSQLKGGMHHQREERIFEVRRALQIYWKRRKQGQLRPTDNPTRLTAEELDTGIRLYHSRRHNSFRAHAQQFMSSDGHGGYTGSNYRQAVMAYMERPLQELSPRHRDRFREDFYRTLETMVDTEGLTRSTVIQSFKRILDELLFAGYEARRAHQAIERYVNAISPLNFSAILLSLVLGCPMILHTLEARLTALYIHFEQMAIESLSWLVKFFEYIHLALVMNSRYLNIHDPRDDGHMPDSVIWP